MAGNVQWKPIDSLQLSLIARHHSGFFADDVNSPSARIAPATIVDARAEYQVGKVKVFAYARNLLNVFALIDRVGNVSGSAEDPRMVGVGVETGF
jgi:outer membrane receptor protein involved in Fe transport